MQEKPTSGHRVCSEHFVVVKKIHENNAPTINTQNN